MSELNFAVFCLLTGLWLLAIVACGLVSGVALLAFVGGSTLVLWAYWRVVVSRPRVVAASVFVGTYLGQSYYMEVL